LRGRSGPPYLNLDAAASTNALPVVADRVQEFLPWYSSVHRGVGYKSRRATAAYEEARVAALAFAGRPPDEDDVAIICRNTTEAINHLAYRLQLEPADVVATTVVEHHANLLPWARLCRRRLVECGPDGTFDLDAVVDALTASPKPRLLAVTGASNVSGWVPPVDEIIDAAHHRGVAVLVAAHLSAEYGIGVRHGCFCAHPYLMRLLGLSSAEIARYRQMVRAGDRSQLPGSVRASAGINTSVADVQRFLTAVDDLAGGAPSPVAYQRDPATGDYFPDSDVPGWSGADRTLGASCARG
jgi:selenocysteine lyase/cysteine desulfurase